MILRVASAVEGATECEPELTPLFLLFRSFSFWLVSFLSPSSLCSAQDVEARRQGDIGQPLQVAEASEEERGRGVGGDPGARHDQPLLRAGEEPQVAPQEAELRQLPASTLPAEVAKIVHHVTKHTSAAALGGTCTT